MNYNGYGILDYGADESVRGTQYLNEEKQGFVDSIYSLFEYFRDENTPFLAEIKLARQVRKLQDPKFISPDPTGEATCPQLNTLNSTMDNMIADYVDNRPEVIVSPETIDREEIARSMTDVMGWVMHNANMPDVWKKAVEDCVVIGTGVIQDMYDPFLEVGGVEGNVDLLYWPAESWLPDPLAADFQQGRAVFKVCTQPLSYFFQHYPDVAKYIEPDGDSRLAYEREDTSLRSYSYDDRWLPYWRYGTGGTMPRRSAMKFIWQRLPVVFSLRTAATCRKLLTACMLTACILSPFFGSANARILRMGLEWFMTSWKRKG
jgi:hypothetical protein